MSIVAEGYAYVIGVDTHARTHTYAITADATGACTGGEAFPVPSTPRPPGPSRSGPASPGSANNSPPASCGNTILNRHDRHGDRHLNMALDIIAKTRMRFDETIRKYVERRGDCRLERVWRRKAVRPGIGIWRLGSLWAKGVKRVWTGHPPGPHPFVWDASYFR